MPIRSSAGPRGWRAAPSATILVAIALGSGLLGAAMALYPGGTALDAHAIGHSFWFNFLCDLTSPIAVNGRPNEQSALLARAGLLSLSLALGLFWLILPRSFGPRCGRTMAFAISGLGVVSVAGLLLVPVAHGWFHVAAVFASSVPALVAGVLGLVGTARYSPSVALLTVAAATVVTSAIDSVLYGLSYLAQPRVVTPALPLFQRVALLLMLAWMALVAVRALRHWRRHAPPPVTLERNDSRFRER